MDNQNLIEKTLEEIKEKNITPKPKWEFILENILKWTLFIFSGIVGALFLVFIYNVFSGADLDIRSRLKMGFFKFLFLALPPIWIILLITAITLAYLLFRSTKYGYRYSGKSILFFVMGMIAVASIISFLTKADEFAGKRMPRMIGGYNEIALRQEKFWSNPEEGLLGGEVLLHNDTSKIIIIIDFSREKWEVIYDKKTIFPKIIREDIIGKRIKIIGEKIDEGKFYAQDIRPWNVRFVPDKNIRPMRPIMMPKINFPRGQ